VALLALLALAAGVLLGRPQPAQPAAQPPAIAAAVASYQAGDRWAPTAARPPARRLGDLRLRRSGQGTLAGLPVTAFVYQDQAGHRVTLLRASRSFPTAAGARHQPTAAMWLAEVDRVMLLCADRPWPSLLVGRNRAEVLLAADQLGLH
jgi:hypothetical protein